LTHSVSVILYITLYCPLYCSKVVILCTRWPEHHEIHRRPMEEREKNPTDQVESMKRRHQELGILPSYHRRTIVYYIIRIALVTLAAVGGYGLYRYIWR